MLMMIRSQVEVASFNRACESVEQLCYIPGSHQLAVIQVRVIYFGDFDCYTAVGRWCYRPPFVLA